MLFFWPLTRLAQSHKWSFFVLVTEHCFPFCVDVSVTVVFFVVVRLDQDVRQVLRGPDAAHLREHAAEAGVVPQDALHLRRDVLLLRLVERDRRRQAPARQEVGVAVC